MTMVMFLGHLFIRVLTGNDFSCGLEIMVSSCNHSSSFQILPFQPCQEKQMVFGGQNSDSPLFGGQNTDSPLFGGQNTDSPLFGGQNTFTTLWWSKLRFTTLRWSNSDSPLADRSLTLKALSKMVADDIVICFLYFSEKTRM